MHVWTFVVFVLGSAFATTPNRMSFTRQASMGLKTYR